MIARSLACFLGPGSRNPATPPSQVRKEQKRPGTPHTLQRGLSHCKEEPFEPFLGPGAFLPFIIVSGSSPQLQVVGLSAVSSLLAVPLGAKTRRKERKQRRFGIYLDSFSREPHLQHVSLVCCFQQTCLSPFGGWGAESIHHPPSTIHPSIHPSIIT